MTVQSKVKFRKIKRCWSMSLAFTKDTGSREGDRALDFLAEH